MTRAIKPSISLDGLVFEPEAPRPLKLGRMRIDQSYIDCSLILARFPGGCMLEVEHDADLTRCYAQVDSDVVLLAFKDDCENHRVIQMGYTTRQTEFVEVEERLLLLLPKTIYRRLKSVFNELLLD